MGEEFGLPEGTHTVALGVGDVNGVMRGKRIPAGHWPTVCAEGNALCASLFAIDMTSAVWDTPYVNFDNGYPDMHIYPTRRPVASPWEEGVAICMGRAETVEGAPVPIDPRNALIRQLDRAREMGFEVQVGPEVEFYLLDPETRLPKDEGIQVYGLGRAAEMEHVIGPIRRNLDEMGIPIEQSNPEYAPGQVEVNIRYDEALLSADRAVLFRSLVKELAMHEGYLATFMSKPFYEHAGSGFHAHYSLWRDGRNAFSDNGKINRTGLCWVGGLQRRMAEMSLAMATTPNAYRRRLPYTFCPVNASWGMDNRTVAVRVIEGSESAVRVEKRDGSADCNPYYLMACDIAAGLDGIEHGLEPGPMMAGNAYETNDLEPLPTDLATAVALAKDSEFMRRVLGEDALTILIQQAERELDFLAAQVTPVELERYLTNL